MLALDRDAFLCDMAEFYHIYDIQSIPLKLLAVYASGLGINSRIRLKQDRLKAPINIVLLAEIVDLLTIGETGHRSALFRAEEKKQSEFRIFDSIEEFEAAKAAIITGSHIDEEVSYGGY